MITIDLEKVFWLVGGLGATVTFLVMVYKNLPSTKLEKRVNELAKYVDNDNKRINSLENQITTVHTAFEEYIKKNTEQSKILVKGMLTLTEINASVAVKLGIEDSKEKLSKYQEELNEYLLK